MQLRQTNNVANTINIQQHTRARETAEERRAKKNARYIAALSTL